MELVNLIRMLDGKDNGKGYYGNMRHSVPATLLVLRYSDSIIRLEDDEEGLMGLIFLTGTSMLSIAFTLSQGLIILMTFFNKLIDYLGFSNLCFLTGSEGAYCAIGGGQLQRSIGQSCKVLTEQGNETQPLHSKAIALY